MKCNHCGGYILDQPDRLYCPQCSRSQWKGFEIRRLAKDESDREDGRFNRGRGTGHNRKRHHPYHPPAPSLKTGGGAL